VGLTLAERFEQVQERIANAAQRAGRNAGDITLIAVSKTVERASVDEAYALGLRNFGENRVQDSLGKFATPLPSDATLHLIGQLQTNKVNHALRIFSTIHSVDRPSLIAELDRRSGLNGQEIDVLLQVNVAGEEQKAGADPVDARSLAEQIAESANLNLRGLMTMAPLAATPEAARPTFRGLRELRDGLASTLSIDLPWLSMGMTNDFEVAIEEGATHVRVGRAIFEP
jgi:pyridoxal phosphate enzyme (YggS family)